MELEPQGNRPDSVPKALACGHQLIAPYSSYSGMGLLRDVCSYLTVTRVAGTTAGWENTIDIVASSMNYMYDVNKAQNSILNIPLFHTPASHFSESGDVAMGDIDEQKLGMIKSFHVFGGSFFHPSPDMSNKQNIK